MKAEPDQLWLGVLKDHHVPVVPREEKLDGGVPGDLGQQVEVSGRKYLDVDPFPQPHTGYDVVIDQESIWVFAILFAFPQQLWQSDCLLRWFSIRS